jgi:hypothetical protein
VKRLTKKQAAIARERLKNPEATQTEIGCKIGVTRQRVQRVLAQPHVQESIQESLYKYPRLQGKALGKKLSDKIEAKTEKAFLGKDGKIIYSKPLEDHSIQLRAVELTLELNGNLKKSLDLTSGGKPINNGPAITINCADILEEKLDKIIAAMAPVPMAKAEPVPKTKSTEGQANPTATT